MLKDAICAAALPTSNLERARKWYSEKLGLEPAEGREGELHYETGKGTGFLLYQSAFAGTNQATAMGWVVTDFEAEVAELRGRGVALEDYNLPGLKTQDGIFTMPDGSRGSWFKDSEGNILSVSEDPR
jgi:catechol 2,3-dioxygenase-like lactoylglutathione lyase family enzyme